MKIRRHPHPAVQSSSLSDIAFLLLVFFIATTVFPTEKGLALLLPVTGPGVRVHRSQVVILHVGNDSSLLWNDTAIDLDGLRGRVEERLREKPNSIFLLKTESEAPYAAFVAVLDETKLGGATRISVRKA